MSNPYPQQFNKQATSSLFLGGCLSIFWITPLVVVGIGLILAITFSQFQINITSAAQPSQEGLSNQIQPTGNAIIAPLFTPEVQYWASRIAVWSKKWGIEANLIATVMQIESCGAPQVISSAGALGLFQVMPYHFAKEDDPFKPATNALRGIGYLHQSLEAQNGDIYLALAGYNGGINGAKRPQSAWPAETVRYVYWGTGIYEDAIAGEKESDRLTEWLNHGGASLCSRAAQYLGLNQ
jgi:hypothetical protein